MCPRSDLSLVLYRRNFSATFRRHVLQVEHLLTENERITAKEGGQGGLTEGQQAQLARNDKAISGIRLQASAGMMYLILIRFGAPCSPLLHEHE